MNVKKRLTVTIVAIALPFLLWGQNSALNKNLNLSTNKLGEALYYIDNYYLEKLDSDSLVENAIRILVNELDPHSSYISAKEVKAMNEPLVGNFEGVGIEFAIISDTLTVAAPIAGGPSERVGIRAGDKIVEVDGEAITSISLTNEMVHGYLRGDKGSRVKLKIVRRGVEAPLEFEVVRDKIPINSVDAAYEVAPSIVYLKLSRFAANSPKEIIESIIELNLNSIKGFILDLRGNSGGYLGSAISIANFFLEKGETIVYTEGEQSPKMVERARGNGFFKKGALAILIDEYSASASEIVAGAVQDWDRGVIIGRKSFGKGLVQQMLPLSDGAQLRLTVARYHTPSGRVIQSPYKTGETERYYEAIIERYQKGESFNRDSIIFPDSLKYKTLKEGRTVYGGGGIMPDLFIAADTSYYSDYYAELIRRGVILEFANNYNDSKREFLKESYKTFESFERDFRVEEALKEQLIKYATSSGVEYSQEQFKKSQLEIESYLKALIARSLFGSTAYFRIINGANDKVFQAALKVVTSS